MTNDHEKLATEYHYDRWERAWLPEQTWQSHLILAAAYRLNASRQPDMAGYWQSRARFHECRACKLAGQESPPVEYDEESNWRQRWLGWIAENPDVV